MNKASRIEFSALPPSRANDMETGNERFAPPSDAALNEVPSRHRFGRAIRERGKVMWHFWPSEREIELIISGMKYGGMNII